MAKHHLYDESPKILHSEEAGHTKVVKPTKKEKSDGQGDEGVKSEGFPIHVRHAHERHHMHVKHEHEHAMHEHHHGVQGKEEMHARHESEVKSMHTKHEKEAGAVEGVTTGESVKKVEKGMKGE
jgi:hypothetical protein